MMCAQLCVALLVLCLTHELSAFTIQTTTPADCVKDGKHFHIGESYRPNPCDYCRCETSGQMQCLVGDCFYVPCVDSVHDPTKCCRQCPNGHNCKYFDGTIIKVGEKYHPDPYTTCECPKNVYWIGGARAMCSHKTPTTSTTTTTTATWLVPTPLH